MHFSPNRNDKVPNDGTMLLTLNGLVIKRVKKTKTWNGICNCLIFAQINFDTFDQKLIFNLAVFKKYLLRKRHTLSFL